MVPIQAPDWGLLRPRSVEATIRFGAAELDTLAMKLRQDLQAYLQVDELTIPEASPGLPL